MTTITSSTTTAKDAFLRFALRLDAIGSAMTGIAGLALAPWIAESSGTTPALEYTMGALFVAYGVVVGWLSLKPHVRPLGVAAAIGNVVYAVVAVAVVLAGVWPLTTTGVVLTLASGVFTLVMADLQYVGLRRIGA